jgi:predicted dehydrogenase
MGTFLVEVCPHWENRRGAIMSKLKVSVIGVGHLGNFHSRIFSEMQDVDFVGVYDVNKERAGEIAEQYKTNVFDSIENAIESADAVSIVVPTEFHYDIAKKCVEAGKHIFVEKPVTKTVEQAEELVKLAKEKNIVFQVGHVERFNAVLLALAPMITKPKYIEVHRLGPHSFRSMDVGVVRDLMIHDIDIVLHLAKSEIESIHALGVHVISDKEDIANARIVFKNGCVANINASRASIKPERKIRIFQDDSYISIDYMHQKAKMYKRKQNVKSNAKSLADYIEKQPLRIKKNRPLDEELKSFVDVIKTGKQPVVTGEHGKRALETAVEIICQIEKSL